MPDFKSFYKVLIGSWFIMALVVAGCQHKIGLPQQNQFHRYTVKSGHIRYEIKGIKSGNEDLYFDNWGMQEARYNTVRYVGASDTSTLRMLTLLTDDYWYYIDLNANKGTRLRFLEKEKGENGQIDHNLGLNYLNTLKSDMGGKFLEKDMVWDKECDVWETSNPVGKIWLWRNIPLRLQYTEGNTETVIRALEIDIKNKVSNHWFSTPIDCVIEKIE